MRNPKIDELLFNMQQLNCTLGKDSTQAEIMEVKARMLDIEKQIEKIDSDFFNSIQEDCLSEEEKKLIKKLLKNS